MSKTETPPKQLVEAYTRSATSTKPASPPETEGDDFAALTRKYTHLVHRWAWRYAGTSMGVVDWHDLVSVGVMGLLQAKRRFDPSSGKPFEAYAEYRIKGAILDELRRVDPLSQPMRRKVRALGRAVEKLTHELGREPRGQELAQFLNLSLEQVDKLKDQLQELRFTSVEELDRHSLSRDLAVSGWSRADLRVALGQAIQTLEDRKQKILSLYYFEGMSMKEIGATLGLTEARISQLHSAAIKVLRKALVTPKRPS